MYYTQKIKVNGAVTRVTIDVNDCLKGENACKLSSNANGTIALCCCNSDLCNGIFLNQQQPLSTFSIIIVLILLTY